MNSYSLTLAFFEYYQIENAEKVLDWIAEKGGIVTAKYLQMLNWNSTLDKGDNIFSKSAGYNEYGLGAVLIMIGFYYVTK